MSIQFQEKSPTFDNLSGYYNKRDKASCNDAKLIQFFIDVFITVVVFGV